MGYYVVKSGKTWDLKWQFGKTDRRHVSKKSDEAKQAGFRPEFTYEQARARAKQLQSEDWVKRDAARHAKSKAIREKYAKLRGAFLTDGDAEEFEREYLPDFKIQRAHWNTMQRIIVGIEIHPSEWFKKRVRLYEQFAKLRCSPNYAKKLLRYLNLWGYFICDKQGRAWMKVPGIEGNWWNKLEEKRRPTSPGQSLPLTPDMLETARKEREIEDRHYRWLFISVWFGLRPEEVDQLTEKNRGKLWDLERDSEHGWILSVFQQKLYKRGILKNDCWKYIPTVFPQQRIGVQYIEKGGFVRPKGAGGKFMRNTFGPGYSHYAGRNNFSGMLRDAGYDLETRKHWMGHLSIKTTESYDRKTQRKKVFYRAANGGSR